MALEAPVAKKDDLGKLRYDLIPPMAMEELARNYTYGANKYGDNNWLIGEGLDRKRVVGAMFRHLWAWLAGEDRDEESGSHHLACVAWGCFTLITYQHTGRGEDFRSTLR